MQHARKMVVMPYESVPKNNPIQAKQAPYIINDLSETKENKKPDKVVDKIRRILNIIYKLAHINGYELDGRIIDLNGNPIINSNIVDLINHSLSYGKVLIGESEFIQLLNKAGVDPEYIINENVKVKLINLKTNKIIPTNNIEAIPINKPTEPIESENYETIVRVPKRTRDNIEETVKENTYKKPKIQWVIPKSTYPKMTFKKIIKKPDKKVKWTEPTEYDKWRNLDNEESEIESENEEDKDIQEISPPDYDTTKFVLKPSKLN
jgi:hypothetical protein